MLKLFRKKDPTEDEKAELPVKEKVSFVSWMTSGKKSMTVKGGAMNEFDAKYYTGKRLGVGSFAVVREVTRKSDGLKFAAKIIDKRQLKEKLDTMKDEISLLKTISHPNLIGLQEEYETDTHIYLVMDLATGGELFDQIIAQGSYVEKDAAALVMQLLQGVKYLHDKDVVHRDLKPENLLFRDPTSNHLMITDFGLSRVVHQDMMLKTACGTPGYVAPEVLQETGHAKPVDMWAVGVITYVLLCGYAPFYGDDQPSLFRAIIAGKYEYEPEFWDVVSPVAKEFIGALLQVDSTRRLTVEQAMSHPWLATESTADLLPAVRKNAKRKLKRAVLKIHGLHRLAKFGLLSKRNKDKNEGDEDKFEDAVDTVSPVA